jgi:fatty-acyl-CoA synthase
MAIPTVDAPLSLGAQIEARAAHPEFRDRPLLIQDDRTWTYGRYRDECVRLAHFLAGRLGRPGPGRVAMLLENHLELLALYGACGYGGHTLFGVNTGLRGDTLAGVVNQAEADVLVIDERLLPEVEKVADQLVVPAENRLVVRTVSATPLGDRDLLAAVEREVGPVDAPRQAPGVEVGPEAPLMIIYTSGTTGLPKGIINNHFKLLAIGMVVSGNLGLQPEDRGYACMPLFHSNAMFLGFMPAFHVGASLACASASAPRASSPTSSSHGVTYWNYVGEPVHYVLSAIEKRYGGDARIAAEVTRHPDNRLRYAVGNGAAPPDIERFVEWFGLEDMFELYGSTEAAISTFRKKTDPRGSVGEITDPNVKILDERGRECPPAELDADGKITQLRRRGRARSAASPPTPASSRATSRTRTPTRRSTATACTTRATSGHVVVRDGQRFLFFDGRTDDWIRKDGENFSARRSRGCSRSTPTSSSPPRTARPARSRTSWSWPRSSSATAPRSTRRRSSTSASARSRTAAWTASGSPISCASWTSSSTRRRRRSWCAT